MNKKCTKCEEIKNLDQFHKDKSCKDGLRSWCKNCVSEYKKENKEKSKEYSKKYRQRKKEEINARRRERYKKNKEIERERSRKYYQNKKAKGGNS